MSDERPPQSPETEPVCLSSLPTPGNNLPLTGPTGSLLRIPVDLDGRGTEKRTLNALDLVGNLTCLSNQDQLATDNAAGGGQLYMHEA